jgi:nucleoporin NUP159
MQTLTMLFSHSGRSPSLLLPPNHLLFAFDVSRLVVGLTHDLVVVFEASPEDNEVSPLQTFLPTTPAPTPVRQMYANPGNIPEIVAILRGPDVSPNN